MTDLEYFNYPYVVSDLLFVVASIGFYYLTNKHGAYRYSNGLLATLFMITIGFMHLVILLDVNNVFDYSLFYVPAGTDESPFYFLILAITYFIYYHLISKMGDRLLGKTCLWLGGYNSFYLIGILLFIDVEPVFFSYGAVMTFGYSIQLLLAFRGWLHGVHNYVFSRDRRRGRRTNNLQ